MVEGVCPSEVVLSLHVAPSVSGSGTSGTENVTSGSRSGDGSGIYKICINILSFLHYCSFTLSLFQSLCHGQQHAVSSL